MVRIRSRVTSVLLAGALALGMAGGSATLAFAAAGGPSGLGAGEAGQTGTAGTTGQAGATGAEGTTGKTGATGTVGAAGQAGAAGAGESAGTYAGTVPQYSEIPAFETVTFGPATFQVGSAWQETIDDDGGLGTGASDDFYRVYESDEGMLQAILVDVGMSGFPDEATSDFLSSMTGEDGLVSPSVVGTQDRTLDGALIRDVAFTASDAGLDYDGVLTIAFGQDSTVILLSVYESGDAKAAFEFQQAHRSLALTEAGAGAGSAGSFGSAEASGGAGTPGGSGSGAGAGSAGTFGSGAAVVSPEHAQTVSLEGFDFTVSTDSATFVHTSISYAGDPLDGTPLIGVPVQVTNASDTTSAPGGYLVSVYGPDGVSQDRAATYFPGDSLMNMGRMRPGATATAYIYMVDEGAGEYVISFDNYLSPAQEVRVQVG